MLPLTPKPFNTENFFAGGAGMFLQYHDIVKPVYFYVILKMILSNLSFGLPIEILSTMSIFSLVEWYIKRRYINPLKQLDFKHILDSNDLDKLLIDILKKDKTIYSLSPLLNIKRLLSNYHKQYMKFPIFVYTKEYEEFVDDDIKKSFPGIDTKYLYGDLKSAIDKCDRNFTYILSDIEMLKDLSILLSGTCSHLLIAMEYRYNYNNNYKSFKYDINEILKETTHLRIGITRALDLGDLYIYALETINTRIIE